LLVEGAPAKLKRRRCGAMRKPGASLLTTQSSDHAHMKTVAFAIAFWSLASAAHAASPREALPPQPAAGPIEAAAEALNDLVGSVRCKKVIVELDEGYGVSSRETRYECPAQN
jgi:hypothetical protein